MTLKILIFLAVTLAATFIAGAMGLYTSQQQNKRLIADRILAGQPVLTIDLRPAVYANLPAPVRRYFDFAFNGQTSVSLRAVDWVQTGEFMLPEVGTFFADGRQINRPNSPVYAFTGWFWRFGLPLIESRDAFFGGEHDMRAKLLGWKTVMQTDYAAPDQISSLHSYLLLRYYGQAPIMPWALLPNEHVIWEARDDRSAYLSIAHPGLAGRYIVHFGDLGQITTMEGDRLLLEGNDTMQREVGTKADYQIINGFQVPTSLDYRWYDEAGVLISHFASRISDVRLLVD